MKSAIARSLLDEFSSAGDWVYDPFCGSGTVVLEAAANMRNVVGTDLSPYAILLSRAKAFAYDDVDQALDDLAALAPQVERRQRSVDLRRVPAWVRRFFHKETLRETIAWSGTLMAENRIFLLACLMGILHHQRPGFLSYPSSHAVPYLRDKKYPREVYPDLYEYRSVRPRLERKVARALRKVPKIPHSIERIVEVGDASAYRPERPINAIVTSPPYMWNLDYGRDNRLRLWFLGIEDPGSLDNTISPSQGEFAKLSINCLVNWKQVLVEGGMCVIVLGDVGRGKVDSGDLASVVSRVAELEVGGYTEVARYSEAIPQERRVRRECQRSRHDTILVLQYSGIG